MLQWIFEHQCFEGAGYAGSYEHKDTFWGDPNSILEALPDVLPLIDSQLLITDL